MRHLFDWKILNSEGKGTKFFKGTVGSVLREVTAPKSHSELFLYIDTGHLAGYFSKKVFFKNSVLTA